MAWQCISPEVNVKGFKSAVYPMQMNGTDDDMSWNDNE